MQQNTMGWKRSSDWTDNEGKQRGCSVVNILGTGHCGIPRGNSKDITYKDVKEINFEDGRWMEPAQVFAQWWWLWY